MKNIFLTLILALFCSQIQAQYQALQIGEKMPDFEFKIQNYKTPTAKISDFKGKLIFFDFWSTTCSVCIAGFPRMEKLQEEFGDQIIIILVNIRETQKEVDKRLKARKKTAPELNRMPSIIGEEAFAQLFPHQYAGNYIWIDPEGVLRLNTGVTKNIHSKKIKEVLAGKEISFLKQGDVYGLTDHEPKLIELIHNSESQKPDNFSLITPIDLRYYPMGGQALDKKDTILRTVRNTYINRTFIELYLFALEQGLIEDWKAKIYGPNHATNSYLDYFHIAVKDSSFYDTRLVPRFLQTDENITRPFYCYEQVIPQTVPREQALVYMKEDLDRYFGIRYGSKVIVEEVEIPCYYLKSANNPTRLSEDQIKQELKAFNFNEFNIIRDYRSLVSPYFHSVGERPYVFLDADLPVKLTSVIPDYDQWKKEITLQELQQVLGLYNLKMVKGTKKIKMIVVRD